MIGPYFIAERTKFDFSEPRKVETPVESSNFSGQERGLRFRSISRPEKFELSAGGSTLGSRPRNSVLFYPKTELRARNARLARLRDRRNSWWNFLDCETSSISGPIPFECSKGSSAPSAPEFIINNSWSCPLNPFPEPPRFGGGGALLPPPPLLKPDLPWRLAFGLPTGTYLGVRQGGGRRKAFYPRGGGGGNRTADRGGGGATSQGFVAGMRATHRPAHYRPETT